MGILRHDKLAIYFGLTLFVSSFLLSGCGKDARKREVQGKEIVFDGDFAEREVRPVNYIENFGDSIYVDDVFRMLYTSEHGLFMTMLKQQVVFHLNENLNFTGVIGKSGEGPGEFGTPSLLALNGDSLYIGDNDGMEVYTTGGEYVRTVRGFQTPRKFDVYDGFVYMNTLYGDYPISKVNLKGEIVAGFGRWRHEERPNYRALNTRFIQTTDEGDVIAVSAVEPVVERYTRDGELLQTLDLSHLKALGRLYGNVKQKNEEYEKRGMFRNINVVFVDVYLQKEKNMLFLLCAGWPGKGAGTYLLVIDLSLSQMTPIELLRLYGVGGSGKSVLLGLSVSDDDRIIAVDSYSGGILVYDITGNDLVP